MFNRFKKKNNRSDKDKQWLLDIVNREFSIRQWRNLVKLFCITLLIGIASGCSKQVTDISLMNDKINEANNAMAYQQWIIETAEKTISNAKLEKANREKIKIASENYLQAINTPVKDKKAPIKDKANYTCLRNGKMSEPLNDEVDNYTFSGECNTFQDQDTKEIIKGCRVNKDLDLCLKDY